MTNLVEFPEASDPDAKCATCGPEKSFADYGDLSDHVAASIGTDDLHWFAEGVPEKPGLREAYDSAVAARERKERFVTKLAEVTDLTEPEVLDILRSI